MKKTSLTLLIIAIAWSSNACDVCERQKPAALRGITHGTGPQSQWDYLIVAITMAIVVAALYLTCKWLIWPGEAAQQHIKRTIITDNSNE